jgi:dTDP-4-amino-4,6-dideoxygalactose transaminase
MNGGRVQFVDLSRQYELIRDNIKDGIDQVLSHQRFIMGPEVIELEKRLTAVSQTRYALSCSSGTDALILLLMAYGVGPGDAVFVPSFTFFATAESVSIVGATPVFVDVDFDTFNMDAVSLADAIARVKAQGKLAPRGVITVDLFGLPANYDAISILAQTHGLFVLEDAAQGFGAEYRGRRAGSLGDVAATSFFPAKPLGCYGDGGAVFMDDERLYELCVSIRSHGRGIDRYDNVRLGMNGRLDTIQAAVLLAKLNLFEDEIEARNRHAAAYTERLRDVIKTPFVPNDSRSVWAQYTLTALDETQRDAITQRLREHEVPINIYYPTPIHLATAYRSLGYEKGSLPVSERLSKRVFSIPLHPYLSEEEIECVTRTIQEAIACQ